MSEVAAINLTINVGNAPKTLGEIKTELQEIGTTGESATDKVTQGVGEVTTATVSLKTQLKQMKDQLNTLDESSPEFKALAIEAAQLEDRIGDVNNQVRLLASDTKRLDGLIGAGMAIGGAFQAAQGAMALFGTESAAVQKAIQNVIAVQGIMNGVMSVANALNKNQTAGMYLRLGLEKIQKASTIAMTAVQKALNVAMAANPIGLIVLGIGLLIAAFVAFKKPIMDVINSFKSLGDVLNFLISPFTSVLKWMGLIEDKEAKVEKQRQDQSKANRARYDERIRQIKKERDEYLKAKDDEISALELQIDTLDAEGKATEELRLQVLEAERDKIKANIDSAREILKAKLDLFEAQAKLNGKSNEEFGRSIGVDFQASVDGYKQLLNNQEESLQRAENNITRFNREQLEKRKQNQQAASDEIVEIEEKAAEEKAAAEAKALKEKTEAEEKAAQARAAAEAKLNEQIAKIREDYRISLLEDQEKEIDAVRLKYEQLLIDAEEFGLNTAELKEAQEYELAQIEEKYRQEKLEADKELREQQVAATIESAEHLISIVESINSIANDKEIARIKKKQEAGEKLTNSEIKRLQRQQKIEKAVAIAQIAIDTAKAISGAVAVGATTGPFPANIPAILLGIAAVLSGVAQANKIINAPAVDVSSGGISDSGGLNDDIIKENTPPNTDQFNTGSTQITPPTKVYVLEQDITDTQGMVAKIKQQATFG
jgi:hypothetical protein